MEHRSQINQLRTNAHIKAELIHQRFEQEKAAYKARINIILDELYIPTSKRKDGDTDDDSHNELV